MTDWVVWHEQYEDPASPLAERLAAVRRLVGEAVAAHREERLRVLSLCAGDGSDVLPVLGQWRTRKRISGRLIEIEPKLVVRAKALLARERLNQVETVCGDAGQPSNYRGAVPADLVTACGIFGNISDRDVEQVIGAMPGLCATDGSVIWTRHRRRPDLIPAIREWFANAGFEERELISPGPDQYAVGWHQQEGHSQDVFLPTPLFTFVR